MIIDRTKENFNNGRFDCYLSDDGTLDTIIEINKIAKLIGILRKFFFISGISIILYL